MTQAQKIARAKKGGTTAGKRLTAEQRRQRARYAGLHKGRRQQLSAMTPAKARTIRDAIKGERLKA